MSEISVKTASASPAITATPTANGTPPVTPLAAEAAVKPRRRHKNPALKALETLASLRLTVVLFSLALALVFFGTLAQIDSGIWTTVKNYFRSFYVWIPLQLLVQFGQVFFPAFVSKNASLPGAFPFPGGWTLGILLLVNLLAAHAIRFRVSWKRAGVLILHAGLILMLVNEFMTGIWAIEGNMIIEEGQTTNLVIHSHSAELAFVDPSGKMEDRVSVVPGWMFRKGKPIGHADLPVDIEVVKWMVNSKMAIPEKGQANLATKGWGLKRLAIEVGEVSGVAAQQEAELPSVYVKLKSKKDGTDLGTYLFSLHSGVEAIKVDGKTYEVKLRFEETRKPYSLELKRFTFKRYQGTNTPKDFASRVRLIDPEHGEDREVTIRMNEPLRHRGDALFQANWNKETEKGTVLQVVRNPAWQLPYWSCGIVAVGMIFHFGLNLTSFLRRRANG